MSVNGDGAGRAEHTTDGADDARWETDPDDEYWPIAEAAGRQVKVWRESTDLTQAELGVAIGYSLSMVSSVERGKRLAHPDFLEKSDKVLGAGGKLAAMKKDVARARYPKKVRDLAKLETEAVEIGSYASTVVDGLLQTEEYARAVFSLRRPAYTEEERERLLAARMARQEILRRQPALTLTFVLDEVVLRRPIGGKVVLRSQLEHLLEVSKLPCVDIQVMPLASEERACIGGSLRVLKLKDGKVIGHNEVHLINRIISDAKEVQILDTRYGMIRAQALTPRYSLAFIKKVLGEMT